MAHDQHSQSLAAILPQVQLIATDMDGTLTAQGEFTPLLLETLDALAQANVLVMIVTGRSAGWVQGLVHYLPIVGAIAETGGVFISKENTEPHWLINIADPVQHRQNLAQTFAALKAVYPSVRPSGDNLFRLTDWTFDINGLNQDTVDALAKLCHQSGWGFTYSTVQCHIRPRGQDKGPGLKQVLQQFFPHINAQRVLTVGDSPNDEGLFDKSQFPYSVGVANVRHYCDLLQHQPYFVTDQAEVHGFQEAMAQLLTTRTS
ncbi:MAG: HAD family hydrolase [Leptolyngbyaceae cyanobacterium]